MNKIETQIDIVTKIADILNPEIKDIFLKMIQDHDLERHGEMLLNSLSKTPPNLKDAVKYGIENLPEERPNKSMFNYFFIISEIVNINKEIRNLVMDAMVFCENDQYSLSTKREELMRFYKKIEPLL